MRTPTATAGSSSRGFSRRQWSPITGTPVNARLPASHVRRGRHRRDARPAPQARRAARQQRSRPVRRLVSALLYPRTRRPTIGLAEDPAEQHHKNATTPPPSRCLLDVACLGRRSCRRGRNSAGRTWCGGRDDDRRETGPLMTPAIRTRTYIAATCTRRHRCDPGPHSDHRLRRLALGTRERIAGAVYGTIVVLAALAAGATAYQYDLWRLGAIVYSVRVDPLDRPCVCARAR